MINAKTSTWPKLFSIWSSTHENSDDFVNQLRSHLNQIETNVQQALNKIQQRKPYMPLVTHTNKVDSKMRNNFFYV